MARRGHVRRLGSAWPVLLGALLGAIGYLTIIGTGRFGSEPVSLADRVDRTAVVLGLGLDHIEISGHRRTSDEDVYDALDLTNVRSQIRLDSAAAKARIERLAWVRSAELTRVLPDRLRIRIVERSAAAIWRRPDRTVFIDETGRELSPVPSVASATLPVVVGHGAAAGASAILGLVAGDPALATRFAEADRIGERRWRIRLASGARVELPAEGEARALGRLATAPWAIAMLDSPGVVVDLRQPDRITVARAGGTPPGRGG
jgi:cell division protein FtsQ